MKQTKVSRSGVDNNKMRSEFRKSINQYIRGLPLNYQHIYVHPCVINQQPCIVYPSGLKLQSPDIYQELKQYFAAKGFTLKEEQRTEESITLSGRDRRRWMPMLLFTASMLFENSAAANAIISDYEKGHGSISSHQVELRLIPDSKIMYDHQELIQDKKINPETQSLKSHTASRLYTILSDHYVKQAVDPQYIQSDLKEMAGYYSQFPEVVSLIVSLKQKDWVLSYDENIWSTIASGSVLQVDKATIHFNTRSAAKLKLHNSCKENPVCIASPADALLHELLHTHSMLVKTEEFIRQGGMNTLRYPYQHEYSIIKSERELYASMSKSDATRRPQRNEHAGRKIIASCVTCIK